VNMAKPWMVIALFVALTLPLMPLQQLFIWFWPRMAMTFPMYYHRLICRILGVRVEVMGEIPQHGPLLLASNHVSWIDIIVLSSVAPVSFVAKSEVAGWPFFGSLARLQRTVFVDRGRRHAAGGSRDHMRERLRNGDMMVLFAEGTSGDGRSVLPFKSSLFAAAEFPGVLVQPVSLAYRGHRNLPMNRRLLPAYAWYGDMDLIPHLLGALRNGPIEVTIVCHPPLSLGGELNRKALARHAEEQVRQGLVLALHPPAKIR
jgi:1-acyl-sn-glycerol-3-phosphate acyltransferase